MYQGKRDCRLWRNSNIRKEKYNLLLDRGSEEMRADPISRKHSVVVYNGLLSKDMSETNRLFEEKKEIGRLPIQIFTNAFDWSQKKGLPEYIMTNSKS